MSEIEDYLVKYFKDWDLTDKERKDLKETCERLGVDLSGFYEMMNKMIEDSGYRDEVIDIIDSSIAGFENDNKKDT